MEDPTEFLIFGYVLKCYESIEKKDVGMFF